MYPVYPTCPIFCISHTPIHLMYMSHVHIQSSIPCIPYLLCCLSAAPERSKSSNAFHTNPTTARTPMLSSYTQTRHKLTIVVTALMCTHTVQRLPASGMLGAALALLGALCYSVEIQRLQKSTS